MQHSTCVLCNHDKLDLAFKLQDSPLAENYTKEPCEQEKYPLELYLCQQCKHLQLLYAVDQQKLFSNYTYETKSSPGLIEHFRKFAQSTYHLPDSREHFIVDIGSNDGTLLYEYRKLGVKNLLGVEPSEELRKQTLQLAIPVKLDFFNKNCAIEILNQYGSATLITANNVFAHSRSLNDMAEGISILLHPEGTFSFEVSYLPLMIKNMVFDFIYHEHLSYHSLKPLHQFFQKYGLKIVGAELLNMKGGSIRISVQHESSIYAKLIKENVCTEIEEQMKLDDLQTYKDWFEEIEKQRRTCIHWIVHQITPQHKLIAYGASATTTTLLHHYQIGQNVAFIVDDNENRIGTFSPGYNHCVCSPDKIYTEKPDYIFIAAWRFADRIMNQHKAYKGRWIIPLPRTCIIL